MNLLVRIALFLGESSGRVGGPCNGTRNPGFGRGGEAAYTTQNMKVPGRGGQVASLAMSSFIDKHYPQHAAAYLSARRGGATHEDARAALADAAAAGEYKRVYTLHRRADLGIDKPLRSDFDSKVDFDGGVRRYDLKMHNTHRERAAVNAANPGHEDFWAHHRATKAAARVQRHAVQGLTSTPVLYPGAEHGALDRSAVSAVVGHLGRSWHPLAAGAAAVARDLHPGATVGDLPHLSGVHAAAALGLHNQLHQALRTEAA